MPFSYAADSQKGGLNGPQEEVPEEKAEEAAHEEQESGEPRVGLIEAQRKGEKVADKGNQLTRASQMPYLSI